MFLFMFGLNLTCPCLGAFPPTSGAASGNFFFSRARRNRDVALIDGTCHALAMAIWGLILGTSDASAVPTLLLKHRYSALRAYLVELDTSLRDSSARAPLVCWDWRWSWNSRQLPLGQDHLRSPMLLRAAPKCRTPSESSRHEDRDSAEVFQKVGSGLEKIDGKTR